MPASFLLFSIAYSTTHKSLSRFSFWFILLLPAILFLYLSWSSNLISVHSFNKAVFYSWGYETPIGKYFYLYLLWFETLAFLAIVFLIRYYIKTKEILKKRQAFLVISAVIIPLIVGSITNGILPFINIYLFPAQALLSSIMSIIVVLAITKYGLFEVTPLSILSSLNHALITVDNKGNILQMNKYSEKMLEVKAVKVIGSSIEKILFVQNKQQAEKNLLTHQLEQVLHKGRTISSDIYTIKSNKQHILPFIISITPVYSQRNVIGANILLRDISKEKEREKQKEDFINMLSHELKTPITSIKAYNQILLKQLTDTNDKRRNIVERMDDQVNRLNRLIRDFFELSRVQTGKLKLDKDYVRIDELMKDIVDTLSVTYKDWKIKINGSTHCIAYIDKDRITQVVINLMTNAMKYSDGKKLITVILSADTKKVTIGIRDYGKGISPEFHKKIFEQFYQIENLSRKNSGMGIGLFIASYFVKIHEGKIWVDSTVGKGSTFYFTLPVSK